MPAEKPRIFTEIDYYEAAQDYLRHLPLEHFMEATAQATQRRITLASLELMEAKRDDVHVFNELLVQYPLRGQKRPGQVVPDNMVVLHGEAIEADGSYDVPLQPVGPFWVLEYVSKSNHRKDYDENMRKYEHELKVPYYLLFEPDSQELTLYRHNKKRYAAVVPDGNGRCAIPELDLEVGLLDGWVRYWFRAELLLLPADLQVALDAAKRELVSARRRADTQARRADTEARRADTEARRADAEKQARLTAERELAELRAQLKKSKE